MNAPGRTSWARSIRQGLLVGVANPKSIVSLMAVLPQFVDHSRGSLVLQMLILGLAGGVVQALIETIWVCAAGAMRTWILGKARRIRVLKASGGVAMITFGSKLAIESP
ncbi:LysE family translocator [Streptomyces sp. NPDC017520]|uniref:LysE family translocator n=1 Tax=Streptomyces sp. NPDC017520 TaxID=3364998 RepID=UPI0037B5B41B